MIRRVSWPGVALVVGSTIYSWFSARPYVSPVAPAMPVATLNTTAPRPDVPGASNAAVEALQLHDWRARTPEQARRRRDIFAFTSPAPQAVATPAPTRAPGLLEPAADGQPPLALFRLIGVAEDAGQQGPTRTAIISGQGQLYLVKEGETVAWIYRVGRMSAESVELVDTTGGPSLRLFLK